MYGGSSQARRSVPSSAIQVVVGTLSVIDLIDKCALNVRMLVLDEVDEMRMGFAEGDDRVERLRMIA